MEREKWPEGFSVWWQREDVLVLGKYTKFKKTKIKCN